MNDNEIAEERAAERRYTEALNRRTVRALQRLCDDMRRKVIAELRARVTQINPKSETLKLLDEIEKGP